ncbi:hypothetical protein MRX96_000968 [Rhipicephalus microplus]
MSGGAQRDAASVAAGVAAGGDAARSWRALHADLRPTGSSADTCAADLKKPSSWEPKPPPLPDADYKQLDFPSAALIKSGSIPPVTQCS